MEQTHDRLPYRISDRHEELQPEAIHEMLKNSYWASERPYEAVVRSLERSLCLGLYADGRQVGFLRAVTDEATIAWICDVIVHPDHRGQGLGKWMVAAATEHPAIRHTQMMLGTRDAHGLYEKYGFERRESMHRRP